MGTAHLIVAFAVATALGGCANRRAAVGVVTGAAAAAVVLGCTTSNSSNNCAVEPQRCARGYVLGIDSRCHREE